MATATTTKTKTKATKKTTAKKTTKKRATPKKNLVIVESPAKAKTIEKYINTVSIPNKLSKQLTINSTQMFIYPVLQRLVCSMLKLA